ncbi:MAG TPA: LytTR family DNA-binding domain-containing protein, partial [Cyclobacteriaceae bacterium]
LIIEDESLAAMKLQNFLLEIEPGIKVASVIDTMIDAVEYLRSNQENLDLIFMDIQLADAISFEIFRRVEVKRPVIFTTAYDQFALEAFTVFSVDYLLKPLNKAKLETALDKFRMIKNNFNENIKVNLEDITNAVIRQEKVYKSKFLVKSASKLYTIASREIAYFEADGKWVYLVASSNKKFLVDFTLEQLEPLLDPIYFFRISRSIILNLTAIDEMDNEANSRFTVRLKAPHKKEMIVSNSRVHDFKSWLNS